MKENEQKVGSIADQKSKIRERYKGITPDELDVIPALPQEDISIRSAGFSSTILIAFTWSSRYSG